MIKFLFVLLFLFIHTPTANFSFEHHFAEEMPGVFEQKTYTYRDRINFLASRGDINVVKMEISAYTASIDECGKDDGITASGKKVRPGMLAAGRNLPFGTKLYIEGYGIVVVEDRGGAIHERAIDIYMETKKEAFEWGRQFRKVYILPNDFSEEDFKV